VGPFYHPLCIMCPLTNRRIGVKTLVIVRNSGQTGIGETMQNIKGLVQQAPNKMWMT